MKRRAFLTSLTVGLSATVAAAMSVPFVAWVLTPLLGKSRQDDGELSVGTLDAFPLGKPTQVTFPVRVQDGWELTTSERSAWVLRTGPGTVSVFSSACPHLGCSVRWEKSADCFGCKCHGARFAKDGGLRKGPARRGLDELPSRVEAGQVRIRWVEFVPGTETQQTVGGAIA